MDRQPKGRPTAREMQTRTFFNAADADAFADQMGKRVTGMSYGTDSIKVTVRPARFEDTLPQPMPKTETSHTRTPFDMNGSISFKPGMYGTK